MAKHFRDLSRAGLAALALMLAGCIEISVAWPPQAESADVQALVEEDLRLRQHHDPALARAFLQRATDPALLVELSPSDALLAHRLAADVAEALDDQVALTAALTRAAASPLAVRADLSSLLQTQIANFDMAGAEDTLRALRNRWPKSAVADLSPRQVMNLERGLNELNDRPNAQLDFERYLTAINWHGRSAWLTSDGAILRQAVQEWELGERAVAEQLLNRLTLPTAIAAVRADRRFDGVVAANPKRFDAQRAARQEVSRLQRAVFLECCRPRYDAPSSSLALSQALYTVGDDVKAVEAAELSQARDQNDLGFEDSAIALSRLALRRGAIEVADHRMGELFLGGRTTPDPAIFMAELLVATDRGEQVQRFLAPITDHNLGRINMDQRIKVLALQVCAAAQMGDQMKIVSALGYIDAHATAGLDDMIDAHLCIGDIKGAAVIMGRMLEDPRRRHSALLELQDWKPPAYRTPWGRQMDARRRLLRARPEVAGVLQRVGRINAYDLRFTSGIQ